MTHDDFVEWVELRIEQHRTSADDLTMGYTMRGLHLELASQLEEVKQKFFTLTPPPTTLS